MKLIAIDVDGTLIPYNQNSVSLPNIEAIKEVSKNHYVSLCTGRCHSETKDIIQALGLEDNYHILGGGGLIQFKNSFKAIGSLSKKIIGDALELCTNNSVTGRTMGVSEASGSWETITSPSNTPMISIEIPIWNDKSIAFENLLKEAFKTAHITHVKGHEYGEWWIQISDKSIHKAAGALYVQDKIGSEGIIAFGDGLNDLELFQLANDAVAMSESPEALKSLSTLSIPSSPHAIAEGLYSLNLLTTSYHLR